MPTQYDLEQSDRYYEFGRKEFASGNYRRAVDYYTKSIQLISYEPDAYNNRGLCYYSLKEFHNAIEDFSTALRISPGKANSYSNRGNCYVELSNYANAISDFNTAIDLSPQTAKYYNNRGYCYYKIKNYKNAIKDFSMTIDIDGKYLKAFCNRGNCYFETGKYKNSLKDYDECFILAQNEYLDSEHELRYNRGKALYKLERHEEAISDWKKSISLNKEYKYKICLLLANINQDEAGKIIKELLEENISYYKDIAGSEIQGFDFVRSELNICKNKIMKQCDDSIKEECKAFKNDINYIENESLKSFLEYIKKEKDKMCHLEPEDIVVKKEDLINVIKSEKEKLFNLSTDKLKQRTDFFLKQIYKAKQFIIFTGVALLIFSVLFVITLSGWLVLGIILSLGFFIKYLYNSKNISNECKSFTNSNSEEIYRLKIDEWCQKWKSESSL